MKICALKAERKADGESFYEEPCLYYLGVAPERVCRIPCVIRFESFAYAKNKGGTAYKTDVL
ncbi:hypothetical protein DXA99_01230 [Eubacterium sp. OF10-16]|jgi:hypothetical protein|nr:hypothetical protein DW969_02725 [Eubacterium sp. AM47-9]RJV81621.1 hypothetical protein DWX37_00550 [Eubacterium sp. AF19-17]RJV88248.1 hypothetical protein DWX13_03615 [Eubacterium sp. AF18-3]RJW00260.1 hypothetical protein DW840_03665 [Eubacterium sp. AM35-6AC]RJW06530.1 hypothetical protein DW751_11750 [Eubacterium sp. AM28-8LB]RJW15372.1 hypothetical protein DXD20_11335 [Eubacterium sp. TF12-12]RJW20938.1 hypothetical protein DXC47_13485 [Eubacterium sp. TF05-29]RJW50150.1 hypothetic